MTENEPEVFIVDAGRVLYALAQEIREAGGLDEHLENRGIKP